MASVGAAAAAGLESGLGLGLRMRAQEQQEEQLKRSNLLADEQAQRVREQDKRLEEDRALAAIEKQFEDLRTEGEGYFAQYGKAVPDDIAGPYRQRVEQVSGVRNTMLRKRYEPILKQHEQRAKDLFMRLQAGDVDIKDVPPAELFDAVRVQSRRDPADFLPVDGAPSKVAAAAKDFFDGLEYGNEGAVLRGANVLLEPELRVGVGEPSPHGGVIVGKQIVKLVPHPADPSKVLPVVKVYVRRGKPQTTGDVARSEHVAEEGAPPGATGYYIAPITENRSTDPDDPPKAIDINQAMEYFARLQTMSAGLAPFADRYQKTDGGDFEKAFYSVRGRMPAKKVEYKAVNPGQRLVGLDATTGKPTGDVIEGGEKPATSGLAAQIQAVQDYADEQGISEAEAAVQLQQQGLLRAPKGAKGGGAGGGGLSGPPPPKGATGQALLDSLSEDDAITVQGLADGSIKPSEISTRGNRREKMIALAKRFDPSADFGPGGRLKEVPNPVRDAMLENNTNMERALRALRLVGGGSGANKPREGEEVDPNATGLKGFLPNQVLNRLDEKGVEARAAIAELGSLIIHSRSGAAVTAAEFPRLAPFIPSEKDDAATVRKKLNSFVRIYREEMEALQSTYGPDNGYKVFKIGGKQGTNATRAAAEDTDRRKSGTVEEAAPIRLPTDDAAARAAYAKLKPGTQYIAPDGTTRTKK